MAPSTLPVSPPIMPPPYVPQLVGAQPYRTYQEWNSYHPGSMKLHPLREVANGGMGIIRGHVPFSMTNLTQCKIKMGWFSEDQSWFVDEFQVLTMSFDLA